MIPVAKTTAFTKAKLPPCALRYHPSDSSLIFLGSYKLEESDKSRHGTVEIYQRTGETLGLLKSIPTGGAILDLKFSPFDDSIVYTAHSTGDIQIWRYADSELSLLHKAQLFDTEVLITSIITSQTIDHRLLLTTTEGYCCLVDITGTGCSEPRYFGSQHELQAWTGAFGNMAELSNVVFTGGDDSCLMAHDTREPDSMAIFEAKRVHDAGITAIQTAQPGDHHSKGDWFQDKPYTLWTGSYDDCLRTFDLRCVPGHGLMQGMPPKVKERLNLGGGVWRFQACPTPGDNRLLTCCMYDGARIIGPMSDIEPSVEGYFKGQHESMVYGCDWNPTNLDEVATCSFYDNVVHLWSPSVLN